MTNDDDTLHQLREDLRQLRESNRRIDETLANPSSPGMTPMLFCTMQMMRESGHNIEVLLVDDLARAERR